MGFWTNLFKKSAAQGSGQITNTKDLAEAIGWLMSGGYDTYSGLTVNQRNALKISTVYACERVISETSAQLPLLVYRRKSDTERERAPDHPLYNLLHVQPNEFQTSFEFRDLMLNQVLMRGTSYAYVNRTHNGVQELLPISPDFVKPKMDDKYNLRFVIKKEKGSDVTKKLGEIMQIKGKSINGFAGVSVVTYARESFGLAMATEKFGAQVFANGAKMSGLLKYPTKFKDNEMRKRLRDTFDELTSGDNVHKTGVLEGGMDWVKTSMTSEDSQFLQTREFQVPEICRWFRVPPHKVMDLKRSTFNNIEHQSLEFVTDTMMPWLVRQEQVIHRDLLEPDERDEFFVEHLVDGLLRGDAKTRAMFYSKACGGPWMQRNEVRKLENLNPIEGLDDVLMPVNTTPVGEEDEDTIEETNTNEGDNDESKNNDANAIRFPG